MMNSLLVATRKGLFRIDRGGAGWDIAQVSFLGDAVPMVLPDARDGAIYAALGLGHFGAKLRRSRDRGETWEELPTPAYPQQPEGEADSLPDGQPWPWRLQQVWSLEAAHASQPGTLFCGTIPGGLFRSDDSGASWTLVRSLWDHPKRREWFGGGADLPGIHSICVDPSRPGRVTIGVSSGGVWQTEDDGASWALRGTGMYAAYMPPERRDDPAIQDPHRVVACPARPDHLWAQHHNGVFRSTNGGALWRDVPSATPSTFGFAVAVHPRDPDTAWLVPAQKDETRVPVGASVVVSRTRDGGETWDVLRDGLPQRHAYDLTFRHALDIDDSGDRLAFGSTTGSLWITEDQGDSWHAISTHLPPIYCVRFMA
ncbi:sialidase [Sorangium cellulosum]|uniref:Sialidase n=1 Tax=Sorangium cellulosum TaxID=56 RepID=A0A150T0T0_SORCE|nr:sialidase [Sorangium cellulosum]KYF98280.1 sialidase [Sorangium cellulosum]